jgi:Tol biopolymer transport system component
MLLGHERNNRRAVLLSVLAVFLLTSRCQRTAGPSEVESFELVPPEEMRITPHQPPVFSPDGRYIAIVADNSEDAAEIWLHRLEDSLIEPLPGTQGASYPFWSPDSEALGFFAEGKLETIRVSDRRSQTICDASEGRGGTWNREGDILFAPRVGDGLYRVAALGGNPEPVTRLDTWREEASHRWPEFLPDGRHFLFFIVSGRIEVRGVYLGSIDSPVRWRISSTNSSAEYVSTGHLLFVNDSALVAQPFDGERFELTGTPAIIARDVGNSPYLRGSFSVSEKGHLLFGGVSGEPELMWVDRNGEMLQSLGPAGTTTHLRLSPDGSTVAASRIDPLTLTSDLWLINVTDDGATQLTLSVAEDGYPVWSPDGKEIVFASNRNVSFDLFRKRLDGEVEALNGAGDDTIPTDWSRDGRFILFSKRSGRGDFDLWTLRLEDLETDPVIQTPFDERHGRFAPDGRAVAFVSNESGRPEIYVRPFPAGDRKWKVSTQGGFWPSWREDGCELYFIRANGDLVSVSVRGSLQTGRPEVLFPTNWDGASLVTTKPYAATAEGRRFLLSTPAIETDVSYGVVFPWTAESKAN